MKETTERHSPDRIRTVEESVIDARLRTALRSRSGGETETMPAEIGVEHMNHTPDDVAASLDLLAIGRG